VPSDLGCWERPEDMDTLRTAFSVGPTSPGSDVAAETAAALAAASLVFGTSDSAYAKTLLRHATEVCAYCTPHLFVTWHKRVLLWHMCQTTTPVFPGSTFFLHFSLSLLSLSGAVTSV